MSRVLRAGADKVAINTAAIDQPDLINEASRKFGSSTIVVSIEAMKHGEGNYECFTKYGREPTGVDPVEWAREAANRGAGEIMVTSIHREGTGGGFDINLTREISNSVSIPVIACGGAGQASDITTVIGEGKANAVSLASLLHYHYVQTIESTERDYSEEGVIDFLVKDGNFEQVDIVSLPKLKEQILDDGIPVRPGGFQVGP